MIRPTYKAVNIAGAGMICPIYKAVNILAGRDGEVNISCDKTACEWFVDCSQMPGLIDPNYEGHCGMIG